MHLFRRFRRLPKELRHARHTVPAPRHDHQEQHQQRHGDEKRACDRRLHVVAPAEAVRVRGELLFVRDDALEPVDALLRRERDRVRREGDGALDEDPGLEVPDRVYDGVRVGDAHVPVERTVAHARTSPAS
jgi:hypothetical protein